LATFYEKIAIENIASNSEKIFGCFDGIASMPSWIRMPF
jgi:hypothetical protein